MTVGLFRNLAVVAACAVSPAGYAAERLVLYFNEDGPRVDAALGKLRAAINAQGIPRRHEVRIEHVSVDYADLESIRRSLRAAVARNPAVIIAAAGPTAQLAREEVKAIPVIFGAHQDPVQLGLVSSLRRPGGGMTGLSLYRSDEGKRLELLRELAPLARNVGVLTDEWWDRGPRYRHPSAALLGPLATREFGLRAHFFQIDTLEQLRRLPQIARKMKIDAWYVPATKIGFDHPREVAQVIGSLRVPAVYALSMFSENGGLASYQTEFEDPFATWAKILSLILDGFPVGEIPVERPRTFELAVNIKAAREQGITIPKSILLRATHFY